MENSYRNRRSLARGFTLVELMVALAIGLLMAFGLVRVFASSSDSFRALAQAAQQIENGRYAMQVISQDLMHAGYYGEFAFLPAPVAEPNPCILGPASQLKTDLAFFVQGYNNANAAGGDVSPGCISAANVVQGTDILVIRRAGTVVAGTIVPPAGLVANEVYIQANADSNNPANPVIAFGADPASYTLFKKPTPAGTPPAEIRKYHVIIYFVSPCNEPNGGGDVCTGGSDDGGRPVPTLKRLTLGLNAAGTALAMRTESIAEGIENLQIRYGIDSKNHLDDLTKRDGLPDDAFVAKPATVAAWGDVMAAQVYVLARTPERSPGWNDTKTYDLGDAVNYTPADPAFQRKLFVSQVRLANPAGRREEP